MIGYLALNAALAVSSLVFRRLPRGRAALAAARLTLALALAAALGAAWLPVAPAFRPAARLISTVARDATLVATRVTHAGAWSAGRAGAEPARLPLARVATDPRVVVALLLLAATLRLLWGWATLARATSGLPVTFRLGKLRVLAAQGGVPFAARVPGFGALVVLPLELWSSPRDARTAIRHELEHHRSADTIWVSALEFLRVACFWNPAAHAWTRLIAELQEFACDETLVGRGKVSPQAYGRCLVKVAEMAAGSRPMPLGATGMAARAPGSLLIRRLEMMIQGQERSRRFPAAWAAVAFLGVVTASGAVAIAGSTLNDRSITADEAAQLVEAMGPTAHLPVTVNELVLRELNRYIGSPGTRESLREGFARETKYRAMIDQETGAYGLPSDLAIVPMHESRYQNLAWSPGAGLWGFIKTTARHYDLVVDDDTDERLDEQKETGAAMRYLSKLYSQFHDWRLALLAYNEGEDHVERKIERFKTRDAWTLERKQESREHYLASITALLILSRNQQLLD